MTTGAPGATQAPRPAGVPRKRRRPATARDMVLSMLVLLGGVYVITLIRPQPKTDPVRPVDISTEVRAVAGAAPYTLLAPRGLPAAWKPTSVQATTPEAVGQKIAAITIGYVVDRDRRTFAQLVESNAAAAPLLKERLGDRPVSGTVRANGVTFERRADTAGHVALTRTAGGVTIIVTDGGGSGAASEADLRVLAGSLAPAR